MGNSSNHERCSVLPVQFGVVLPVRAFQFGNSTCTARSRKHRRDSQQSPRSELIIDHINEIKYIDR